MKTYRLRDTFKYRYSMMIIRNDFMTCLLLAAGVVGISIVGGMFVPTFGGFVDMMGPFYTVATLTGAYFLILQTVWFIGSTIMWNLVVHYANKGYQGAIDSLEELYK